MSALPTNQVGQQDKASRHYGHDSYGLLPIPPHDFGRHLIDTLFELRFAEKLFHGCRFLGSWPTFGYNNSF
jgi:hypothetical protein